MTIHRQKNNMTPAQQEETYRDFRVTHFDNDLWVSAGWHDQANATLRLTPDEARFLMKECFIFLERVGAKQEDAQ
jgi:hypothetical protein